MTNTTLFFLDIDGTLLDSSYRSNEDQLRPYIQQQEKKSRLFGLNSNRALEDLLPVAEQFGINGPLVGENGLFVYYPGTKETEYLLDSALLEELVETKVAAENAIRDMLMKQFQGRVHWENVDTVETLSQGNSKTRYAEGDIVVLNNKFRKYTVSAHIKLCRGGEFVALPEEDIHGIVTAIQQMLSDKKSTVVYSSAFGNILLYTNRVSKRTAVEKLRQDRFKRALIYAIGDELSDYYMIKDIGTFLTVGNAPDETKKKAVKIAEKSFAQGVLELLKETEITNG